MRSCFTFGETRDVESGIISSGVPSLLLMENAGANFSFVLKKIFPDLNEFKIFIVTGKGNNAGDGFVIARHLLIDGYDVSLIMLCDSSELKGDVKVNFDLLIKLGFSGLSFSSFGDVNNYKKFILIDAVLGTGLSGSPQGIFAEAIVNINKLRASKRKSRVVSVDVPSGLAADSDICVNADFTITMGCEKAELLFGKGKESTGEVHIADIGIGSEVFNKMNSFGKFIPDMKDINALFPRRKKSSYKYSNGKALIIGGSRNLSGALIMSSLAALRTGCGAVISAYPESVSSHLGRKLYEAIKLPLNETTDGSLSADSYDKLISQIDNSDAVLIGPGLSLNSETGELVINVIMNCKKNVIADADALTHIAGSVDILKNRNSDSEIILTPHIGEFSRLTGCSVQDILKSRFQVVRDFCKNYNVNLVLKSETSISVLKSGEIFINPTGSELLATAGSGDVLSGIMVSLLAMSKNPMTSMICANFIHGLAADIYSAKHFLKQSALQRDIIELIPDAISAILN